MTEFVSEIKKISFNAERVYAKVSDLSNLSSLAENIPTDKLKDLTSDKDSCSFTVASIGKITFRVIEREPNKLVKLQAEDSIIPLTLWLQLKEVKENDTRMKLTVKAELNTFIKPMVKKPLQEAINKIADVLTAIPY